MSVYTEKMVSELNAHKGPWTYNDAAQYASEHSLNVRSVISKVKNMGLDYIPREKAQKGPAKIRKADLAGQIAKAVGGNAETLAGLAKADTNSLQELLAALAKR